MASSTMYNLVPLDEEKKEIRLLRLTFVDEETVNTTEPIRCDLIKASLLDPPNFNALSYTWGVPVFSQHMQVTVQMDDPDVGTKEFAVAITENLHSALIHVRTVCSSQDLRYYKNWEKVYANRQESPDGPEYPTTSNLFWVDARSVQYRFSSSCLARTVRGEYALGPARSSLTLSAEGRRKVWLRCGAPTGSSDSLSAFGEDIHLSLGHSHFMEEWLRNNLVFRDGFDCGITTDGERFLIGRKSISWLLALPYWSRTGILQEVYLGRRVIFYYGLGMIHSAVLFHALSLCGQAANLAPSSRVDRLLGKPEQVYNFSPLSLFLKHEDESFSRGLPALLVRMTEFNLRASNPKDYIFGMLGMAEDSTVSGMVTTYSMSCRDIYTKATRHCITSDGLQILSFCKWSNDQNGLPSWVPEFSEITLSDGTTTIWKVTAPIGFRTSPPYSIRPFRYGHATVEYNGPLSEQSAEPYVDDSTDASEFIEPPANVPENYILTRPALFVDMISEVMPRLQVETLEDVGELRWIWQYQIRLKYLLQKAANRSDMYPIAEDRLVAFALVLSCGGFDRGRGNKDSHFASAANMLRGFRDLLHYEPYTPSSGADRMAIEEIAKINRIFIVNGVVRTLDLFTADDPETPNAFDPAMRVWLQKLIPWIYEQTSPVESIKLFLHRLEAMHGAGTQVRRRLFFTKRGYIGIGPEHLRAGDSVALLDGGYAPFVLRRTEHASAARPRFNLLGESYVHGLMDREPKDYPQARRPLGMRASMEANTVSEPIPTGEEMVIDIV